MHVLVVKRDKRDSLRSVGPLMHHELLFLFVQEFLLVLYFLLNLLVLGTQFGLVDLLILWQVLGFLREYFKELLLGLVKLRLDLHEFLELVGDANSLGFHGPVISHVVEKALEILPDALDIFVSRQVADLDGEVLWYVVRSVDEVVLSFHESLHVRHHDQRK